MTEPTSVPQPAVAAGAFIGVFNGLVGVAVVLGAHIPSGLGVSVAALAVAVAAAVPVFAGFWVRNRVSPVAK